MIDYEKTLTKGTQASLDKTPITNNKLRFTTDTGRLFLDINNEDVEKRIEISDFIKDYTEFQILSIETPLPKIYLSSDTAKLFIYIDGKWNICGGDSVKHAEEADKAISDELSQNIASTYIKSINYENGKIKFTFGDNNSSSFDIAVFDNNNNGFVPKPSESDANKYLKSDGTWEYPESVYHSDKADESIHATEADNATNDANGNRINTTYAPLNSPALTGTPTVPDAAPGSESLQIANTKFVANAIANAIAGVTQFDSEIVTDKSKLPSTGVKGKIYFVANNSGESENIYDEYIWIDNKYECLGPHKLDLSGYFDNISTTGTGNAITSVSLSGSTITFNKGATFLTEHPSVTTTSGTTTASPAFGGTVTVIDGLEKDKYGHVTNYKTKTITIPNSAGTGSILGLTKLYASTGSNSDGTITQKAITEALNGKASSTHNHDGVYQPKGSYASANHTHDGVYQPKGSYASANHTHSKSQITDFPTSLPCNGIEDEANCDFEDIG